MSKKWEVKRLSDVLKIQNGYAFDSKSFSTEKGTPLIRIRDIKGGYETETRFIGSYDKKYEVKAGDFLIGMDGEFGCHEWKGGKALLNQRVCRLQDFSDRIYPRFLFYGINEYLKAIEDVTAFTTVKHISSRQIENIEIPLPALQEQQRIVSTLDEAYAAIAKAIANTERNLQNAKELFESYLQAAFTNPLNDWKDTRWGDLCHFVRGPFGGSLKKSIFKKHGYVVYEQKHAIHDHFDQLRYFIDEAKFQEMRRFEVRPGDIIMSCSGVTLGRVAIVPEGIAPGIINQALLKLTPLKGVSTLYLKHWLRSRAFQNIIAKYSKGAAIPNVPSARILKEILIPIPDLRRQNQIVESIELVSEETKNLESVFEKKIKALGELRRAFLQNAFNGQLEPLEKQLA